MSERNVSVFERTGVLNRSEMNARYVVFMENYIKQNLIEANTMISMLQRQILPAVVKYQKLLAETMDELDDSGAKSSYVKKTLKEVCDLSDELYKALGSLKSLTAGIEDSEAEEESLIVEIRDKLLPAMDIAREKADALEMLVDAELWPLPTYAEMLFEN